MTAKDMAKLLNGREYGDEISSAEEVLAKENGLVVVYGYSDDNMEFAGAIHDEIGCYDGGFCYISREGVFDDLVEKFPPNSKRIDAIWCGKDTDAAWTFETDIPHETFKIYEDGGLFCEGIVFSLGDL